ncbi:MAG: hypothetical protein WC728_13835 [Elusimicrobiota bacterium]
MPPHVLIATATPWESRPLAAALGLEEASRAPHADPDGAQHLGASAPRPNGVRLWKGRFAGKDIFLVETGMGPAAAAGTLATFEEDIRPGMVLSAGFAGALQRGLSTGLIVADLHAAGHRHARALRLAEESCAATLRVGRVATSDSVLCDPAEKSRLGAETGALAVDMESATVGTWAGEKGSSFVAVRAILDRIDQRLPRSAPASASAADLARYALSHLRDIPLLIRLAFAQRTAMRELTDFLRSFLEESP